MKTGRMYDKIAIRISASVLTMKTSTILIVVLKVVEGKIPVLPIGDLIKFHKPKLLVIVASNISEFIRDSCKITIFMIYPSL